MYVKIGPYKNWWGAYQLADLLRKVNVNDERCDKIGDWLANTWVHTFCSWVDSKRNRTIKVRIDDYDTWSMDATLAYIILPMLKQLKKTTHGAPNVDDKDVPEHLRSIHAPSKQNKWDTDDNWHDRWDWVLDEMIWVFEQVNIDWEDQYYEEIGYGQLKDNENSLDEIIWDKAPVIDRDGLKKHGERMQNGFTLFGKYFQNLWD